MPEKLPCPTDGDFLIPLLLYSIEEVKAAAKLIATKNA
jgi:hypothetical protein